MTSSTQFHGRWSTILRVAWLTLALLCLGLFVAALPARFAQLLGDPDDLQGGLEALGFSMNQFAIYGTLLDVLVAVLFFFCGAFLFWRRPDDRMVWLVSLSIVMYIITVLPDTSVLGQANPIWTTPLGLLRAIGLLIIAATLILFPDGRFVPGWTRGVLALFLCYLLLGLVIRDWAPVTAFTDLRAPTALARALPILVLFPCIVVAQIYRYRVVSTSLQRQQTKWVVLGFCVTFGITAVLVLPLLTLPVLQTSSGAFALYILLAIPITLFVFFMFPLTIAIATLRYHLWEIDILIRKTLTYTLVAGLLAIVYFSSVILLQQLFSMVMQSGNNEIVTVVSTLAIAALFVPLRNRIQTVIDRRFYRKKYDAQQVLQNFAETVRDETDLERLTGRLMQVVHETMQPTSATVWLKKAEREVKR